MAAKFTEKYCGASDGNSAVRNFMSGGTWGACKSGRCYSEQFDRIYLDRTDDLYVTMARNEGEYSTSGGASRHNCRWSDERSEPPIECWFFDMSSPEGDIYKPAVLYGDSLSTSTSGLSPLAAPFLALSHEENRFAVFPRSILSLWPRASGSSHLTHYREVSKTKNARDLANAWFVGSYDNAELEVEICEESEWMLADESRRRCSWHGVDDADFAERVGVDRR